MMSGTIKFIKLNVVMLSVVMLNVVAPKIPLFIKQFNNTDQLLCSLGWK